AEVKDQTSTTPVPLNDIPYFWRKIALGRAAGYTGDLRHECDWWLERPKDGAFYVYQSTIWRLTGKHCDVSEEHQKLLIMQEVDKERKDFERLKSLYDSDATKEAKHKRGPFLKMCASRPGVETKASAYNVIVTSDLNTTTSYQYLKAAVTPCATSNCFAKRVTDKKAILYEGGLLAITRCAGRSILQILPRNRTALITLTRQPLCRSIPTQPFTSFSVGISRREGRRD
ncbi:uncharacterized protein METZ01_LOCUS371662, partial [marine metagenome]